MKKYLVIAMFTLGMALTACGGGTKTETAPATDAVKPAVTTVDTTKVKADTTAVKVDTTAVKK